MFKNILTKNMRFSIIKPQFGTNVQKGWKTVMIRIGKKKYVIKSTLRFTMFITILCILAITAASAVLGLSNVKGMTAQQYIRIQVKPGDTLWCLAGEYMPNTDIRKSINVISEINDTSASELYAGQVLKIPVEKN